MPKRKPNPLDLGEENGTMLRGTMRKKAKASYTTAQKAAMTEFQGITGADSKTVARVLKAHNWNLGTAVNAYYNGPQANTQSTALRANITKLFDRYRDSDEPDEIGVEGMSKLLGEMDIGLDDIGALVFSELVQSPSLGKLTREGFVDGCAEVGADTVPKLRQVVVQRRSQLGVDLALFRKVYNHTFVLALQSGQKSLAPEMATEFWRMLFSTPGMEWRTARTPWLTWWLEFLQEKWKKAVNKDLWRQTLVFALESMKDDDLGFWNEESSWPSVIDEFVEWVGKEKRAGQQVDEMDVE